MSEPLVSICVPSLGRPTKLARLLDLIPKTVEFESYEVVIEYDDFENRQGAPKTLKRAVERARGDLIAFLGNDVIPRPGWLREAVACMRENFPERDGMVGLNDGIFGPGDAAAHWLCSRKLLPMLDGEFFHTGYAHVAGDLELTSRCRQAGKYAWAEKARILHDHYCDGAAFDEVYWVASNPKRVDQDHDLLKARSKLLGFPIPEITRRFSEEGLPFFDAPQEIHPERLFVIKQVGDPTGLTIVDAGCGEHKTLPSAIGVDVRPVTDRVGSLDQLPFDGHSVDVLISRHSLEHALDTVKALREWRRVLKPEGKVIIVLPDHGAIDTMHPLYSSGQHLHAFTQDSFRNLIEAAGILRIEQLGLVVPEWSFGGVLTAKAEPKVGMGMPVPYPPAPPWIDLRPRLGNLAGKKVLNIGVGPGGGGLSEQLHALPFDVLDHIEIHLPYIERARERPWNAKDGMFYLGDVRQFPVEDYDIVMAFDILEHLEKSESLKLISRCPHMIVFIPIEDTPRAHRVEADDIPSQDHISTWLPGEFEALGFRVEVLPGFHRWGDQAWAAMWCIRL